MSKWVVDIHGDIEGDYEIIEEYKEPKTGHWEWEQYDNYPQLGDWSCSECKSTVIECVRKDFKGGIPFYKYCPQCGANMESEVENGGTT